MLDTCRSDNCRCMFPVHQQQEASVCMHEAVYSVAGMRVHKPDSGNIFGPVTCNLFLNSKQVA